MQNIELLGELRIDTPETATFFKLLNFRIPQKVTPSRVEKGPDFRVAVFPTTMANML